MGRRSRKARHRPHPPGPQPAPRRSAEERNAEIRATLEPYAPRERPLPLVVAAALAAALGVGNLIAYAAGMEIDGKPPAITGIVVFCGLMFAMVWGLWNKRYWAVLGFEALLAITVIVFFLLLLRASSVLAALVAVAAIALLGFLFWKLIRVMARVQTPERPGAERRARPPAR